MRNKSLLFGTRATEYLTDGSTRHRMHPQAPPRAVAAFGVLTPDPWRDVTTLLWASHYLPTAAAADVLLFRYLAFAHEAPPPDPSSHCAGCVALLNGLKWNVLEIERSKHHHTEGNQCVLKILQWFAHAMRNPAYARLPFVGYIDRDTWLDPVRMALFLRRAATVVGSRPAYGGSFEHAHGYNESSGIHTGYSIGPVRMADPMRSFAFAFGGFVFLSPRAVSRLFDYIEPRHALLHGVTHLRARGKCAMTTDVSMGWLIVQAFAHSRELVAVHLRMMDEVFKWTTYASLVPGETLVVHGIDSNRPDLRDARTLWFYDAVAALVPVDQYAHVASTLTCVDGPPRKWNIVTSPHARQHNWTLCHTSRDNKRFPRLVTNQHPILREVQQLNRTRALTQLTCTARCKAARMCDGIGWPVAVGHACPPNGRRAT